ncbi:MAG: heparinase II/III family protein, partial [Acidobacteriota bacterium]
IVNRPPADPFAVYDDLSGIAFENNVVAGVKTLPGGGSGFERREVRLETSAGGLQVPLPEDLPGDIGARRDLQLPSRDDTGPEWYPKPISRSPFGSGRVRRVAPGDDTLTSAVEGAESGDVLELSSGEYVVEKILSLDRPVTVRARANAAERPRILFRRSTLFELGDGGSLKLEGVEIDGSSAPDAYGNSVIRTSRYSMLGNYRVLVSGSKVANLNTNHSFDFLKVAKHTFADRIEIRDSEFSDVSGHVIELDREIDDLGIYNAEYVTVTGSSFRKIGGALATVYRGGTDESTFGPHVAIEGNTLEEVGGNRRNKTGASVFLHGAQVVSIRGNRLVDSEEIRIEPTVGEPIHRVEDNVEVDSALAQTPDVQTRLLISAEAVRSRAGSWRSSKLFSRAVERTRARVDAAIRSFPDVPVPRDAGGGYTHEQHKSNGVAIHDAGLLYLWTGDAEYARHARDLLLAYAELYPSLGEHPQRKNQSPGRLFWQGLNEAVWLVYSIQGFDAVRDTLTAEERGRIESRLLRPMAEFLSVGSPGTFNRIHNHGTWAAAAVGMTGYALDDPDSVEKALLGLEKDGRAGFLRQIGELFSPDGYYAEGPYYQRYALMPFVLFAKVIERNEPERGIFEFRDGVLLRAIYTTIQLSYGGRFFPLNDAIKDKGLDTVELDYAIAIAHGLTGDPSLASLLDADSHIVLTEDGLGLALAKEAGEQRPFPFSSQSLGVGPSGDRGALSILRQGESALVFEATAHGMGHGHFDRLSWLFYDNGREIVSDYGAARFLNVVQKNGGRYLPENLSWAKQTVAHNTLVVDGESQFGGDRRAAERTPPEILHFRVPDDETSAGGARAGLAGGESLRIVSARDDGSYPGVQITRTLATLSLPDLEHPVVLDVLHARSPRERRYDLPLYYQGQLIESLPAAAAARRALEPVGTANGYQHLWARGQTRVEAGRRYSLTWLNGGRFYSYGVTASTNLDVLLTEVGANDPDFNLRREPGLMLRTPPTRDVTFFALLEPHGEYSGAREFTRRSRSQISKLEAVTVDSRHWVSFETAGGRRVGLAIALSGDAETEHSLSLPDGERRWTGHYHLFQD